MKKEMKYIDMPSWFYPKRISVWGLKWFIYFAFLYFILWIPLPFTYTTEIYLGPFGMPLFVWGWIVDNVLVVLGLLYFYQDARKVGFYNDEEANEENGGDN
jgi:hypothetical protein